MEARLCALYKKEDQYQVLSKFKGETLKGKTYLPLFPYYAHVSLTKRCVLAFKFIHRADFIV